ncbi:hypothetical protein [Pseudomonas sp. 21]|uniref:hypothetical protein n=1 Tax=Pseudomonas sp. 21 TaxID=1619948 RepID=UPI0005EB793D|nr:hypothetical protein [Pseudomonas sp. 21]
MTQVTNTKEIKLQATGMRVLVRELTVAEVRSWLESLDQDGRDLVDRGLFEDASIPDLIRMTSLTREQIDEMQPSAVREVIAACKEANPDFFGFQARLMAAQQAMLPAD